MALFWWPGSLGFNIIWASMWETLIMLLANNKGADQPARLCSLISAFVIRYLVGYLLFHHFLGGLRHVKASGYAPWFLKLSSDKIWKLKMSSA